MVYLSAAAASLQATTRLYGLDAEWAPAAIHVTTTPLVFALTRAFARLCNQDRRRWNRIPVRRGLAHYGTGLALGSGAFLSMVGMAYSAGWVVCPAWGWEGRSKVPVVRSLLLFGIRHTAVAWNEEMVFRGYGLDTVTKAVGRPTGIVGLAVLFSRAHGRNLQVMAAQGALAIALTSLRLESDSLWLPVGYHFAWNYVQTAVLGPPEWPSIRPLHVTTHNNWLGHPGYPEPGYLAIIVHLAVALAAVIVWWWQAQNRRTA
ncbi:MAG: hypothetical protein NVS2B7_29810 [Herpetosiphon sp.]